MWWAGYQGLLPLGHSTKAATAVAIYWISSTERPVGHWATDWPEVVEFSSALTGELAGRVEVMILVGILCNTTEQLNEATIFWFLRYETKTRPTFRFEHVHAYCQLAEQPSKCFFDEILTCNDAFIYS